MTEPQQTLLQLVVPAATAAVFFLLAGKTRERLVLGALISTLLATTIVIGATVAAQGISSTLAIGVVYTALIAFLVSSAVTAGLYRLSKSRSD